MESRSFATALMGVERKVADSLAFPDKFHHHYYNPELNECPFIRVAGTRDGLPAIYITRSETNVLSESHKHTIIGKFNAPPPSLEQINRHFEQYNLSVGWKVGFLDGRHLMIQLQHEEDYAKIFSKRFIRIDGFVLRFLKWTPQFDFRQEPPISPVWIKLPYLKLHLFHKQVLFSIGAIFGKPLKLDLPTSNLSRPSCARILIEMDVLAEFPEAIWLGSENEGYWQQVVIENRPKYCSKCKIFGHSISKCFIQNPELRNTTSVGTGQQHLDRNTISVGSGQQHSVIPLQNTWIPTSHHHMGSVSIPAKAVLEEAILNTNIETDADFTINVTANIQEPIFEFLPVIDAAEIIHPSEGCYTERPKTIGKDTNGKVLEDTSMNFQGTDHANRMVSNLRANHEIVGTAISGDSTEPNSALPSHLPVILGTSTASGTIAQEIHPDLEITKIAPGLVDLASDFTSLGIPVAADSPPAELALQAMANTAQIRKAKVYLSEEANSDSDSYETYTSDYREEDMNLNEACKEVLEEWQEEWEYQKSKKKQKGIRELKSLLKGKAFVNVALGSRRSMSGHRSR